MTRYKHISPKRIQKIQDNIFTCEEVISRDVCNEIISIGESRLKPAKTVWSKREIRTNQLSWLDPSTHPALNEIKKYCAEISGLTQEYQEIPQFLKYSPGEFYGPHEDYFPENYLLGTSISPIGRMQRGFTFLFYLNSGQNGGGTRFPKLSTTIQPKVGKLLMWKNMVNGKPNLNSTHEGLPPKDWTKYALTIWVRTP